MVVVVDNENRPPSSIVISITSSPQARFTRCSSSYVTSVNITSAEIDNKF